MTADAARFAPALSPTTASRSGSPPCAEISLAVHSSAARTSSCADGNLASGGPAVGRGHDDRTDVEGQGAGRFVDDGEVPDPADAAGSGALDHIPAVRLLIDRARTVLADFDVTSENREAVATACAPPCASKC